MGNVGEMLAKLRREKGLGQKQMAALLNMSVGTISNYENGVHAPDLLTLCRLAEFFQVTTDYLLGRSGYRCPPEELRDYFVSDYTACDLVNTVLSLDPDSRISIVNYVNYIKSLKDDPPQAQ